MNNRERTLAVLNYEPYDRLPLVHFGYWDETLEKWATEGHLTNDEVKRYADGNAIDLALNQRLGFDFGWNSAFTWNSNLEPPLEPHILEQRPDGSRLVMNENGAFIIEKPGIVSIPTEVDHLFKGRKEWEEIFKPRLQFGMKRLLSGQVTINGAVQRFDQGGLEKLLGKESEYPVGIYCGSLLGVIRDWLGLVNLAYLMVDDEPLFDEVVEIVAEMVYQGTKAVLEMGIKFDYGHFWEDICYRGGPLVNPRMFARKFGPNYRRITALLSSYGTHLVSLDCDGKIDALLPTWLENGVNVMFPIEVGVWEASIRPWREKYGKGLLGIGGVNKHIFGRDRSAINAEIERLRPLVELGGYIPCPDHRLPIEARWENIQYYCEKMSRVFE